jgi:hypothetical protein
MLNEEELVRMDSHVALEIASVSRQSHRISFEGVEGPAGVAVANSDNQQRPFVFFLLLLSRSRSLELPWIGYRWMAFTMSSSREHSVPVSGLGLFQPREHREHCVSRDVGLEAFFSGNQEDSGEHQHVGRGRIAPVCCSNVDVQDGALRRDREGLRSNFDFDPRPIGIVRGIGRPPVLVESSNQESRTDNAEQATEESNPEPHRRELNAYPGETIGFLYSAHSAPLGAKVGIIVLLRLLAVGIIGFGVRMIFARDWLSSIAGGLIAFSGVLIFCGLVELMIGI